MVTHNPVSKNPDMGAMSGYADTHDPLCYLYREDGEFNSMADICVNCRLIAKVRADERKQAGARVAERPYWEDEWPENLVMNRVSAIDAVRGES